MRRIEVMPYAILSIEVMNPSVEASNVRPRGQPRSPLQPSDAEPATDVSHIPSIFGRFFGFGRGFLDSKTSLFLSSEFANSFSFNKFFGLFHRNSVFLGFLPVLCILGVI